MDMKRKVRRSWPSLYIQEEEEEEENEELQGFSFRMSYRRIYRGEYFIPSQVTSYFGKNAIQSRLQSQLMEKVKMLTMTEKIQGALRDIGMKQKETLPSSLQEKLSSAMKKIGVRNTEWVTQKRDTEVQLIRKIAEFMIA
uniref:Uncharacterized protein n=1 Tax=Leersia perrieri TaxID=77586 RepID=A0A0D9VAJ0_9ORYZ